MPAGRLLTLCVLWGALVLEDKTVSLRPIQNPEKAAPKNLQLGPELYTSPDGNKCKMCPPGSYVSKHCTGSETETVCSPCENGTFYNSWNLHLYCHRCKVCRTLDQVEIKACTTITNTECACKNGSFCSPEHPCETCHICMPRCPPGEEKVQECTPTSNLQCRPSSASPSPPTGSHEAINIVGWVVGSFLILAVAVVAALCWWKKTRSCRNSRSALSGSKMFLRCLKRSSSEGQQEEQDNVLNAYVDESQQPLQSSTTSSTEAPVAMLVPTAPPPEGPHKMKNAAVATGGLEFSTENNLVPANGNSSGDALRKSFDIFIKVVPLQEWERYMRALDLTDNEIESAKRSGNYTNEKQYEMLRTWRDKKGKAASVNDLLKELCGIGYRGTAEDITSTLISDGLYVYEV